MFTRMRTCAQQTRSKAPSDNKRACTSQEVTFAMLAQVIESQHQRLSCKVCPSHLGTPSAAPTGCQLGIGPQVSQSRALLATSSLQRRPLEPSMLIVYLGGACSPPEAGGVSMINCTGGCPSMAKRYRWFATSPGSVTGPDTTSSRSITKREPPPCSSPVEVAAQESQRQLVTQ